MNDAEPEIDVYTSQDVGCASCIHPYPSSRACAAFPGGIPWQIFGGHHDHRKHPQGSNGIQWQSRGYILSVAEEAETAAVGR